MHLLTEYGALPLKAQRIAEVINDYDDTLFLQFVPPADRTAFDLKPYRIIQVHPNYEPYVVMYLAENELDHRVLEALFNADVNKNDLITRLDNSDRAKKAMALKEQLDRIEEEKEFALWAIKSNKRVKHKGVVYE